jgi:hypothetical protein
MAREPRLSLGPGRILDGNSSIRRQIAMTDLADLIGYANDSACQAPATFSGVGRHEFLQKQAFFPKKACLPAIKEGISGHGW